MNLVIVESPAKCGKIQGFLGSGFKVIASMGHIRHLKEDLDSIGLDKNFDLTFEFMKEKKSTIEQLKMAKSKATTIYLAADDDREGELIAYSVCLLLGLNPQITPRAVFHEITEKAVKSAIASPRLLDMNKVNAAQTRAALDMMIGFTMSPLLWKAVGPSLSAGRCQTAALRLVCEREEQISSFESCDTWKVKGEWKGLKDSYSWPAVLSDDLEDEDSALTYLEIHHSEPKGKILKADTTVWSEKAPYPLITSTLQQQSSSLFMSQPKQTMNTAQRLYEAGYITYMRTDKAVLSDEATLAAQEYVSSNYGDAYISTAKVKVSKKKDVKAQEAHEAIRPTDLSMTTLPETEDWSSKDRKIYRLIWTKTLQSVMSPTKGEQRTVVIVADGDDIDDFTWRASWRRTIFDGWRRISLKEKEETEEEEIEDAAESEWNYAISLKVGQSIQWTSMKAEPHSTKAKQHYNEAKLINVLEENGIGRPSTFANLISTIIDRKYVETKTFASRDVPTKSLNLLPSQWPPEEIIGSKQVGGEKNRLTPTELGKNVLQYLLKNFDDLFQYTFTANMEKSLDKIAEGEEEWKKVLSSTWGTYKDRYIALKAQPGTASSERRRVLGGLVAVIGKKGPLLLKEASNKDDTIFYGWPAGIRFEDLTEDQAKAFVETAAKERQGSSLGEYEGYQIIRKEGKFGYYINWNGINISCKIEDTLDDIISNIKTKQEGVRRIGLYEIRNGPYGLYMFKTNVTGPSRKFVSVPANLDLDKVTESDIIKIFQEGLKAKARSTEYVSRGGGGSGRGRGRGRGNWRGK
jgi:DNA topoisomerase-1